MTTDLNKRHQEREKADQELTDQGLSGFTITRDGIEYEFVRSIMIPIIPWLGSGRAEFIEVEKDES